MTLDEVLKISSESGISLNKTLIKLVEVGKITTKESNRFRKEYTARKKKRNNFRGIQASVYD